MVKGRGDRTDRACSQMTRRRFLQDTALVGGAMALGTLLKTAKDFGWAVT